MYNHARLDSFHIQGGSLLQGGWDMAFLTWNFLWQLSSMADLPHAYLSETSATTQMHTPNLLLSAGSPSTAQVSLGLSNLLPHSPISFKYRLALPTQLRHTFIPSWSQEESLGHLPGSLSASPMTVKEKLSRRFSAVKRMIREVSLLFSYLETEGRTPGSSMLIVAPPSGWETTSSSVCYSAVAKVPYPPQARGLKTSSC